MIDDFLQFVFQIPSSFVLVCFVLKSPWERRFFPCKDLFSIYWVTWLIWWSYVLSYIMYSDSIIYCCSYLIRPTNTTPSTPASTPGSGPETKSRFDAHLIVEDATTSRRSDYTTELWQHRISSWLVISMVSDHAVLTITRGIYVVGRDSISTDWTALFM